jgi:hypothetical protein
LSRSPGNGKSKSQIQAELDDANDYIEELESKLDDIAGIAAGEEEEEEDTGADGADDDDQD